MVKIRLKRMGAKKAPFYRIVVADSRSPRGGKTLDEIGTYDPTKQPSEIRVDTQAAQEWIKKGAQPTDTVKALLKKAGAYEAPLSSPEVANVEAPEEAPVEANE